MLPESQALFSICLVCNNYANSAIITRAQLPASILVFGFFWLFLKVSLAFLGPGNLATLAPGVCGVTDQRFHNSREMFELYATKSCLFLLKAMYVMGNVSDIMDLLILWRLDALFGCGRANSEVDAWSGER